MPFTPFHWGPGSWVGLLLCRFLNVGAFLGACVVVDVEPLLVMVFGFDYPLHGYLHTYLIGSLVAVLFSIAYFSQRAWINRILVFFKVAQDSSYPVILISCLLGVYSHVFLDSFLYTDIRPFFPLTMNPQYGLFSSTFLYSFCAWSFALGGIVYAVMLVKGRPKTER